MALHVMAKHFNDYTAYYTSVLAEAKTWSFNSEQSIFIRCLWLEPSSLLGVVSPSSPKVDLGPML